jgi:hypothetical protein
MNEEQFKKEFRERWGREPQFMECLYACSACHPSVCHPEEQEIIINDNCSLKTGVKES